MGQNRSVLAIAVSTALVAIWVVVGAGQAQDAGLLQEPLGVTGEAILPAWEGWGPNRDGKDVFLIGYFNRNQVAVDVPIGPDNRIEPGGPDLGQPTHFRAATGHTRWRGRHYGVFAIELPEELGNGRLTWTLKAFGHTTTVNFWRNPPYRLDFFKAGANGNEPPRIKFQPSGTEYQGPPPMTPAIELTGTVDAPVSLSLLAADKAPTTESEVLDSSNDGGEASSGNRGTTSPGPVAIIGGRVLDLGASLAPVGSVSKGDVVVYWAKYRGPGAVRFDEEETYLRNEGDPDRWVEAQNRAYFSAPGEYWLLATVSDGSDPMDQCCWTTAHVKVTIE
jgi:hypothetical protein